MSTSAPLGTPENPVTHATIAHGDAYDALPGTVYEVADGARRSLRRPTLAVLKAYDALPEDANDGRVALLLTAPMEGGADPHEDDVDVVVARTLATDFFACATRSMPALQSSHETSAPSTPQAEA